jgi:hypothetical protein
MRTSIASTIPAALAAGNADSDSSAMKNKELQELKEAQNYVEMNMSNFNTDVRRTREGYVALPNVAASFVVAVTCALGVCLRPAAACCL